MFDGGLEPIGEADEDAMLVGPLLGVPCGACCAAGGRPPKLSSGSSKTPDEGSIIGVLVVDGRLAAIEAHDNAPCALGSAAGGRLGETSALASADEVVEPQVPAMGGLASAAALPPLVMSILESRRDASRDCCGVPRSELPAGLLLLAS